jgi:putative aldouronate transport system substrate-binding protein
MRWGTMGDTFKANTWLQNLEATSNVIINWNAVSNEGWGEARNLLLLSGDLPDVFIGNQTVTTVQCWRTPVPLWT